MRQVSSKPRKSESDNAENVKPTAQDVEEFGEDKKEKETTTVVSGAKTGGLVIQCLLILYWYFSLSGEGEAFPKAAVKAFHDKPQPTHEKPVNQKPNVIQQPRKC